jgi:hypothetical protein
MILRHPTGHLYCLCSSGWEDSLHESTPVSDLKVGYERELTQPARGSNAKMSIFWPARIMKTENRNPRSCSLPSAEIGPQQMMQNAIERALYGSLAIFTEGFIAANQIWKPRVWEKSTIASSEWLKNVVLPFQL